MSKIEIKASEIGNGNSTLVWNGVGIGSCRIMENWPTVSGTAVNIFFVRSFYEKHFNPQDFLALFKPAVKSHYVSFQFGDPETVDATTLASSSIGCRMMFTKGMAPGQTLADYLKPLFKHIEGNAGVLEPQLPAEAAACPASFHQMSGLQPAAQAVTARPPVDASSGPVRTLVGVVAKFILGSRVIM